MATQVIMPKLSPTMEEGQLSRWLKKEGDKVSMGEPLAEIDTDKATMEMQALGSGVLRKILIQEGESAPLGQLIAIIGEPDEDISALSASTTPSPAPKASPAPEPAAEAKSDVPTDAAAVGTTTGAASGNASGNGSRDAAPIETASTGRLIVSPLAARMAAESGIDLRTVNGSGPGGRIIKRDVEELISGKTAAAPAADQAPQKQLRAVDSSQFQKSATAQASAYRDEPASEMRRTIAKRLVTSLGPVPHFFLTTEIEMDRAAEMRKGINELDPELKISVNDIIIKVAGAALMQHPQVNASFQDKIVRYYEHADIGVAVAIEEGLITPIVRGADQKSLSEIANEVRDLADRARHRKLRPEEYLGASFSVSNLGMFGIDEFTAIINPPEAAILAVGAMSAKPVVRNNELVIRQMMRVTMSCDHRVVDGATGAKFLQTFKKILENPLFLVV
ncbi:MAG TPA: pyruvate dehydrogenase complex dihydrolipoamide acetyltransferase [Pyrinomonadaceae bacterium]|jgi:pyruvate dehydrogenase E2 component (dihydrolipoamide acetyltransferase)|nr:pyruvate dehydrogenase complex dihydrolipoamide acetyltransferase [Pyrinomonadaceae bacterium]